MAAAWSVVAVSFDIGNFRKGLPLRETQTGVYMGEYAVLPGDNAKDMPIVAYLRRPSGPESRWIHDAGAMESDRAGLRWVRTTDEGARAWTKARP